MAISIKGLLLRLLTETSSRLLEQIQASKNPCYSNKLSRHLSFLNVFRFAPIYLQISIRNDSLGNSDTFFRERRGRRKQWDWKVGKSVADPRQRRRTERKKERRSTRKKKGRMHAYMQISRNQLTRQIHEGLGAGNEMGMGCRD